MNRYLLILFLAFYSVRGNSNNSNFDFSGMDEFWNIVQIFESNREPGNNDWERLFKTPGYNILVSGEFNREFFKNNFRLVFKPSEKNALNVALTSGKNIQHLNHYIKVKDNKRKIKDQQKNLERGDFNKKAISRALEFLPESRVSQSPPVSFVIFESNGRGSSPIVVDLAATLEWDFMSFLSHEYHHWYRNRELKIDLRVNSSDDRDIINTLSLIEAEGIADMVDKKDWFTKPNNAVSEYARHFINDVGKTPQVIKRIDETLTKIKTDPSSKKKSARTFFSFLPQRGHTTGYFMASLILENFSKAELTKCVGNPFEFILLYNKAAKRTPGRYPSFSNESIAILTEMNSKYSK